MIFPPMKRMPFSSALKYLSEICHDRQFRTTKIASEVYNFSTAVRYVFYLDTLSSIAIPIVLSNSFLEDTFS